MTDSVLTTDELVDLVSRCQIIEAEALWQYLTRIGGQAGLPQEASDLVADLVREGLLTHFQGEHLLAGDSESLLIGKYLLLDRLGDLDSSVYLAKRKPNGPRFALKLLHRDPDLRPQLIERFHREAEALARLDHPAIVSIKDSGEDGGRLFLVMEYIDGQSLTELVQRHGPLPPASAVRVIHAALEALSHIHEAGLVLRNLQPGHLMIDRDNKVRLVDLGLARFLDEPNVNLTMLGGASQLLGAVEYQSPEQLVNSHDVDIRTDIYALGAILYFLCTGRAPFGRHSLLRLSSGVVTHPQPLSQLRPDLPLDLVVVAEKMMARLPEQRYQTPEEAQAALDRWLNEVSPPPLQVPRRSSPQGEIVRPPVERLNEEEANDLSVFRQELIEPTTAPPQPLVVLPQEPAIPPWLLALFLFGATVAIALAANSLFKLF